MLDEVGKYFLSRYPNIFLIINVFAFALFISWKVFRFYGRFERVEGQTGKSEEKIDSINIELASIQLQLTKIAHSFDKLILFLSTQYPDLPVKMLAANSPLQLTEAGKKMLVKFGGKEYVDSNIESLMGMMEEAHYRSPLDVQYQARHTISWQIDTDEFTPIKNFIFNNPQVVIDETNTNLTLRLAISLMAIYLRDRYFKVYPELLLT